MQYNHVYLILNLAPDVEQYTQYYHVSVCIHCTLTVITSITCQYKQVDLNSSVTILLYMSVKKLCKHCIGVPLWGPHTRAIPMATRSTLTPMKSKNCIQILSLTIDNRINRIYLFYYLWSHKARPLN